MQLRYRSTPGNNKICSLKPLHIKFTGYVNLELGKCLEYMSRKKCNMKENVLQPKFINFLEEGFYGEDYG